MPRAVRRGWWLHLMVWLAGNKKQKLLGGAFRAPRLEINHPREAEIREWAAAHMPISFTASDGFAHAISKITVSRIDDTDDIQVFLHFDWSYWTNAEDEHIGKKLAQRTAMAIACWLSTPPRRPHDWVT